MKAFFKVFFIITAVILALIIAAVATIPLWLPADKLKDMLVEQITAQTGRDAVIDGLKFDIFKGIELTGVSLKESARYKKRDFIKDDKIILKYNLPALFAGELVISKFELIAPYCEIVKEETGKFNFSDIIEFQSRKKEEKTIKEGALSAQKKNPGTAAKKIPFLKNIIITSVKVSGGKFAYADYSKEKPVYSKLEDFNFDIEDIVLSAVKPISMELSCVAFYNEYKLPVSAKAKIKADLINKSADLSLTSFLLGGISSTGTVKITNFSDAKGTMTSSSTLKKMMEILPGEMTDKLKDINADMDVTNEANFSYISGKLKYDDTLSMDKGSVLYKDRKAAENIKGKIKINSDFDMTGEASLLLTGNEVSVKLSGSDIMDTDRGRVNVDIYSPKFAVEYLVAMFPKKSTSTAKAAAKSKSKTAAKKKEIKSPGVYISLKADSIYYKDVTAGKTISSIRFNKGKLYSETSMSAYEGHLNINLIADINTEDYSVEALINKVKIHEFVDDAITVMPRKDPKKKTILDDMKDKVYGTMDMKAGFSGSTFKDTAHTMSGKGGFSVKNGRLTAVKMAENIGKALKIDSLQKDIPFELMAADFAMAGGKISTNNFRIYNGPNGMEGDMKIEGAGYETVDDKIDFRMKIDFNPRVAKEILGSIGGMLSIKDTQFACNKDGWLPVDVRVYNTVKEQKYDLSQPRMTDNIKKNMVKKVEDQGKKYIEDKAKDLIKNLFGK